MMKRTVRVAAAQMGSRLGQTPANLDRATPLVEKAAREGAQLIVLPELAASGYSMSKLVWDAAETREGPTIRWLGETARRLRVHVGIGFVEADAGELYNSYALASPDGRIAGCIRKTMAETYCFRCAAGSHVVETELGRIGVGICADTHFLPMVHLMRSQHVDLMIMPHAWPGPCKVGGAVSEEDVKRSRQKARDMAPLYARLLGVPAVFANMCGSMGGEKWAGILGGLMRPDVFRLLGLSTIADSDGGTAGGMDEETEGVVTAEVLLDPGRKSDREPEHYGKYGGGWLHPIPSPILDAICSTDAFFGRLSYRMSAKRRTRVCEAAGGAGS